MAFAPTCFLYTLGRNIIFGTPCSLIVVGVLQGARAHPHVRRDRDPHLQRTHVHVREGRYGQTIDR